jgi:hypothetical protein
MPAEWTPLEAAAFFALDLVPGSALQEWAMAWMVEGPDSPPMRILVGDQLPSRATNRSTSAAVW